MTATKKHRAAAPVHKPTAAQKRRALAILDELKKQHPDAHCELDFTSALELLVATILAAQCTDKRVNEVTKSLFRRYRSAADYASADPAELENAIRSTGFFRNKTKSIQKCAASIVEQFGGEVPESMDDLLQLAGVGRKSANVIRVNVYNEPGIVVDTHMLRIARRMGFTLQTDATKVERDLMALFPGQEWAALSKLIPWHGRRVCPARKPDCENCGAAVHCPKLI